MYKKGEIDHTDLLTSMDEQISRAKEEASSRKAIMEKVEKWILARDEKLWLEEYSRVIFLFALFYMISCLQHFIISMTCYLSNNTFRMRIDTR